MPKAAVAALGDALINIDTSDKKSFEKLIDCNGRVQFSEVAFHHLVDLFNEDGGDPSQASRMWRSPATSEALQRGVPESPKGAT